MSLRRIALLASLLVFSSTICIASGEDGHRQHGAHVHGIAQMNLAVDGKSVYLELASPAMNIVGFEYMPSSDQDQHAVHEAAEKLEDGDSLFEFSKAAGCTMVIAEIKSPLLGHEDDAKDSHGKEHDENHNKDDDRHDAHGKEHDEQAHDKEHDHSVADEHGGVEHSEFEARYQFNCNNPKKLKTLTVNLFTAFPGFEEIETQILSSSGQTATELTAKNNRVDL
jgi:hypothetical protein